MRAHHRQPEATTHAQHHPQVRHDRRRTRRPRSRRLRHRRRSRRHQLVETQARPQREALADDVAAKVKAAALEKVPGATVLRTEAGGPYGTPYHAHIRTADGTAKVVLVDSSFEATAVQSDRGRRGRARPRGTGRARA